MDIKQTGTTGFAVLDKNGTRCTEEGVRDFKAKIDEHFPGEAGNAAMAIMGDMANNPLSLAAMLENGTCGHVFVRVGDRIRRLDPKDNLGFAEDLRSAPEGATSWEVAVRSMGEGPETEG